MSAHLHNHVLTSIGKGTQIATTFYTTTSLSGSLFNSLCGREHAGATRPDSIKKTQVNCCRAESRQNVSQQHLPFISRKLLLRLQTTTNVLRRSFRVMKVKGRIGPVGADTIIITEKGSLRVRCCSYMLSNGPLFSNNIVSTVKGSMRV